tara:strand:- start:236 stop:547 length:312 start_codon:yes stop_codon:yes gene_type:complete
MERIVDPLSGKMENIFSQRGRELLKLYILNYSVGGCNECKAEQEARDNKKRMIKDNFDNVFTKTYKKYLERFLRINWPILGIKRPPCKHDLAKKEAENKANEV